MHAEAVLLVDDRRARDCETATLSWNSACVPIVIMRLPCRHRRSALVLRACAQGCRQPTPGRHPSASSQPENLSKCCSARISVGAMIATWKPFSIACSAASAATMGLAAAHVALEQALHGVGLREVALGFRPVPWLGAAVSRNGSRSISARASRCSRRAAPVRPAASCGGGSACASTTAARAVRRTSCGATRGWRAVACSAFVLGGGGGGLCRKATASRKPGRS